MKNAIFSIFFIFTFASCRVQKHVETIKLETKSEQTTDTKTEIKERITENIDSVIKTKADTTKKVTDVSDLLKGVPILIETGKQSIEVSVKDGKVTTKAVAKSQDIPVNINKVTERTTHADVKQKTKQSENLTTKKKEVVKTSLWPTWWVWLVPVGIGTGLVIYRKYKRKTPELSGLT